MPLSSFPSQPIAPNAAKPLEANFEIPVPSFKDIVTAIGSTIVGIGTSIVIGIDNLLDPGPEDEEKQGTDQLPIIPGGQAEIELEPGQPPTPTDWYGGTLTGTYYWINYQKVVIQNGQFAGWGGVDAFGVGQHTFSDVELHVNDTPDEDIEHWSYNGLGEEPHINTTGKQYKVYAVKDGAGAPQQLILILANGVRVLGFSDTPGQPAAPGDQGFNDDATDPIVTAKDAGKAVMSAPIDLSVLATRNNQLLQFLLSQNDKLLQGQDVIIFNQRQQLEIFSQLLDNALLDLENGVAYIIERLGAQETEIVVPAEVPQLPQTPEAPALPDLEPAAPSKEEPLLLPDGGEGFLLPPPELLIDYTPQDQREGRWSPPIVAVPDGRIPLAIAQIQDCVCIDLTDCCNLLLQRLAEVKEIAEDVQEDTEDIQWELQPPLPGSPDLLQGTIAGTSGGSFSGLGKLVWVHMSRTVEPTGSVKITFGNNSGQSVSYVGWFSWEIDGKWTEKQIITWSEMAFVPPRGARGFQFTATHKAEYSVEYWTDNRATP